MSTDYKASIAHADECKQTIRRFRVMDDPSGTLDRRSFASKAQHEWIDIIRCYREAMDIYHRFNQPQQAKELFADLLDLAQVCDEHSSHLAIQVLLSLDNSIGWLETVESGARQRVNALLQRAIWQKLLEFEMDFWLLRSALEFSRGLVDNETDRRTVDTALCQVMELAAQVCLRRGNLDGAEGWYRDAARFAQDRVGYADWASRLLELAANINLIRNQRVPAPEGSDAPSTTSIADDLSQILKRSVDELRQERFLPTAEEFQKEYADTSDKLGKLLEDERLILDRVAIEARASKYRGKGLLGWLHGTYVAQGNPRGEYNVDELLAGQFVAEIVEVVGAFFHYWQETDDITEQQITAALKNILPSYDWRLFSMGLFHHFQGDFVSSAHILVPQFENIIRRGAEASGAQVMKFKAGVPGAILLNDLINPENTQMEQLLGAGLFHLIYWYFVKSDCPFGYRHKIAHGWLLIEECANIHLSAMTIYLALKSVQKFTVKSS